MLTIKDNRNWINPKYIHLCPHKELPADKDSSWLLFINPTKDGDDMPSNFGKFCHCIFDDIDEPTYDLLLLSSGQARDIADFIIDFFCSTDTDLFISCPGGVSRSAAVFAATVQHFFGIKNHPVWNQTCPNMHVFRLMMNAFERGDDK